jgi:hypothetical protein
MTRKAYSYIRFSGKRQEAGDSYRRQEAMAEAAAKEAANTSGRVDALTELKTCVCSSWPK